MNEAIVWLDVETSGVSPEADKLLEVAMVVSDMHGEHCSDPFSALIDVPNLSEILKDVETPVKQMHEKSGLWRDLWENHCCSTEIADERATKWVGENTQNVDRLYMGGNSLTLDRQFVRINLPRLYNHISYRSVDVTSLSLAIQSNSSVPRFEKEKAHRALPDVYDSIKEFHHYLFWLGFRRADS